MIATIVLSLGPQLMPVKYTMEVPESSNKAAILFSAISRCALSMRVCLSCALIGTTSPVIGFKPDNTFDRSAAGPAILLAAGAAVVRAAGAAKADIPETIAAPKDAPPAVSRRNPLLLIPIENYLFRKLLKKKSPRPRVAIWVQNGQEMAKILLKKMVDNFGIYAFPFGIFCRIFKDIPKPFQTTLNNYEEPLHLLIFFTVYNGQLRQ
jgi:hypothetical protein